MPTIFGNQYTRDDLEKYTSTIEQIAGLRSFVYDDGKARGLRAVEVWTGGGLRFTVYLDRALDIGPAEFAGTPLAWLHPALGVPAQYESGGYGWLRTFGGGLVTTCGLTHFGQPDQEDNQAHGLHGRISNQPAQNVCVNAAWQGDDYLLTVTGQVRQAVLFGENLLMTRRITTRLGAKSLTIEDTIRNEGFRVSPFMLLYHCNFGFPLAAPGSQVEVDDLEMRPRDASAAVGLDEYSRLGETSPAREQVFFHTPRPDAQGLVSVAIRNPQINLGVQMRYRAAELPALSQWKNFFPGEYVCALEPCTNHEGQRAQLRQDGRLRELVPGEQVNTFLEISVVS
jgi:hypothetical protein